MRENSCESVSGCSHSTLRKVEMATAATNTAPASPRCNGSALGAGRGGGDGAQQAQQVIHAEMRIFDILTCPEFERN